MSWWIRYASTEHEILNSFYECVCFNPTYETCKQNFYRSHRIKINSWIPMYSWRITLIMYAYVKATLKCRMD